MIGLRAYTAAPSCVPARAAIFTGQSQTSHGRVGYRDCVPGKYETTLPGKFASAGYHNKIKFFHNVLAILLVIQIRRNRLWGHFAIE